MSRLLIISIISFFSFSLNLLGQNSLSDSLHIESLDTMFNDINDAEKLLDIASEALFTDKGFAEKACEKSFEVINKDDFINLGRAYCVKGNILFYYDNYAEAINAYFKALKIYETNDYSRGVANAYNLIGNIKAVQKNFPDALEYYKSGIKLRKSIGDTARLAGLYNNIGGVLQEMGLYDEALINFKLSEQHSLEPNLFLEGIRSSNMADCYFNTQNYDQAIQLFEKSILIKTKIEDLGGVAQSLIGLSKIMFEKDSINKAQDYAKQALKIAKANLALTQQAGAIEILKNISYKKQDYKEAYEYGELFRTISDSIMSPKISDKIKALESDYLFEKEVKISELKQEKQTLFYYIIFSLLILVISLISMLWIIQKQKSQKLKQKQVILKIEREELKKDIYNKEKTIISNTLHIVEKNELISQVTEKIELAIQKLDAPSKKKILNIIKELNSSKNAKLWEEFELRFVDVHKDFYNHLQESHPDLTPNERRLCAFLKLNMSTKEISSITLQSQESIEKARTRLRKKFNLTNTNTNLVSFLSQY